MPESPTVSFMERKRVQKYWNDAGNNRINEMIAKRIEFQVLLPNI